MSSESTGTGGGKGGSNGTGAGGSSSTTGAGGNNPTTGAGGNNPTTGAGGSNPTTGAGGSNPTTGAGGSNPTTGAGGAGGSSTTTGAGGAGGSSTTTGAGGTSGGVCPTDPAPEANCNTTLAKTGATCTKDCCITCGYQGLGAKNCTCMGGVYTACPCPRPATYMGAATAPYCDSLTSDGMGMTASLKNMPCTTLWQECIGRDVVSGTTPQGCVCLLNATTNANQWYCSSTNKWFTPM